MSNIKICRIGHRNPRNGVITIASEIVPEDNKIYWGASYCSPREPNYIKSLGNDLALECLEHNKLQNIYSKMYSEFTHSNIIKTVLSDMFFNEEYPRWAESLILEQLRYPTGLIRYPKEISETEESFNINKIIVSDQKSKEQLILALSYMAENMTIDFDFIAVNSIINVLFNSDKIVVE